MKSHTKEECKSLHGLSDNAPNVVKMNCCDGLVLNECVPHHKKCVCCWKNLPTKESTIVKCAVPNDTCLRIFFRIILFGAALALVILQNKKVVQLSDHFMEDHRNRDYDKNIAWVINGIIFVIKYMILGLTVMMWTCCDALFNSTDMSNETVSLSHSMVYVIYELVTTSVVLLPSEDSMTNILGKYGLLWWYPFSIVLILGGIAAIVTFCMAMSLLQVNNVCYRRIIMGMIFLYFCNTVGISLDITGITHLNLDYLDKHDNVSTMRAATGLAGIIVVAKFWVSLKILYTKLISTYPQDMTKKFCENIYVSPLMYLVWNIITIFIFHMVPYDSLEAFGDTGPVWWYVIIHSIMFFGVIIIIIARIVWDTCIDCKLTQSVDVGAATSKV